MSHKIENKQFTPDIQVVKIKGSSDDVAVPFNQINLSNQESILVSRVEGETSTTKILPKTSLTYAPYVVNAGVNKVKRPFLKGQRQAKLPSTWNM